jgi:hypothetical protein
MNSNKRGFESSFDSVENDVKKVKTNDNVSVDQEEIVFLIKNSNNTNSMFGGIKWFNIEQNSDLIYYETLKTSMRFIQKKYVIAYKYVNSDSWIYF